VTNGHTNIKSVSKFGLIANKKKFMIFKEKTGLDNIDIDIEYIDIDIEYLEQIKSYKYLGSSLNRYNYIREEIKGRIKSWTIKLIA